LGAFVRIHDAEGAKPADPDDVSRFEIGNVCRHLMPIDFNHALLN